MKIIIAALTAVILLISCDKNVKESADANSQLDKLVSDLPREYTDGQPDGGATDTAKKQTSGIKQKDLPLNEKSDPDWDKKIIKNGILNVQVKDFNTFSLFCRDKIRSLGGYVAQEEQHQSDYKIENTLVVRVPVDQFDNALNQLVSQAEKVNERKVTSQDVSSEYTDVKSRIEAKRQVRLRYMELVNQARNMEEILKVQSEINQVQEEIEAATGRVNYLGNASAYSTIHVTFFQVLNEKAAQTANQTPAFGERVGYAFKAGWSWITELLIGLVSVWPLFIIIGGIAVLYKRSKSSKANPAA